MDGFRKFLLRGNLIDLAVAVVIGAAFGAIVTALVADFITPLIGAIIGKTSFATLSFTINKSTFLYGDFINKLLTFVIIAAVVYFLVIIPVGKMLERFSPTPDEPTPMTDCTECLSSIPAAATKCAFCASAQKPVKA